ncbi:MAG: xanthine dehydrogenase family protein molybdopterin-binding subunit [Bacteroidetes bacterium]|jgi:CO/xanthine dehydrogenase Mo-binding subunit|nr:xanthine dehydrogenase family protein molybdopterin-binding subunit [Bacteroidota bacterium]
MTSSNTIDRREFIKVASAAGTGLVLAFYLPATADAAVDTSGGTFEPNVWLRIGTDNRVTITLSRSEMGQGIMTSMAMIVADELDADWKNVSVEQAIAHPKKYGSMSTGGSWSIRGHWDIWRKAGATARMMLLSAAAAQWKVEPSTCKTEPNVVLHSTGKKLSYGELASAAAALPVPTDVVLKDPSAFRYIGKRMKRLDTPAKVKGTAIFGIDIRRPGMLFASVEQSAVFGGKAVSHDATQALAIPGVVRVLPTAKGIAVVATSTWAAFQGREALKITWDEGQWATQSSESIWATFAELSKEPGTSGDKAGDALAALPAAAKTVEAIYRAPLLAHATMEPMNCTADVRTDGTCELWVPSQSPQAAQTEAARVLGVDVERVKVNTTLLGGGFGRRLAADYVTDAVQLSKELGKPVQVVWTREDDMQHDLYRPMTYNVFRGGLDAAGELIAWHHRIVGPNSRGLVTGGSKPPYAIPNYLVDYHLKEVGVPIGAWRAVGPTQNGWVVESFVDEMAHAAKKDPYEFRRALLANSPRLKRALEFAADKAKWGSKLPKGVGRGIAAVESFGSSVAEVAEVSVEDGKLRIHRIVVAVDCGPVVNPDTIEAQVESALVMTLTGMIKDEITIERGRVKQSNFDDHRLLTFEEMPKVEVYTIPSTEPVGGIGEPALPPAAPAICNAIFAASGIRIRTLPLGPDTLRKR